MRDSISFWKCMMQLLRHRSGKINNTSSLIYFNICVNDVIYKKEHATLKLLLIKKSHRNMIIDNFTALIKSSFEFTQILILF